MPLNTIIVDERTLYFSSFFCHTETLALPARLSLFLFPIISPPPSPPLIRYLPYLFLVSYSPIRRGCLVKASSVSLRETDFVVVLVSLIDVSSMIDFKYQNKHK